LRFFFWWRIFIPLWWIRTPPPPPPPPPVFTWSFFRHTTPTPPQLRFASALLECLSFPPPLFPLPPPRTPASCTLVFPLHPPTPPKDKTMVNFFFYLPPLLPPFLRFRDPDVPPPLCRAHRIYIHPPSTPRPTAPPPPLPTPYFPPV